MKTDYLFAVNLDSEEITVSESPAGSNQVHEVEKVKKLQNEILYNAVVTLTQITKDVHFDMKLFKAMDKVCQMAYQKYKLEQEQL